MCGFCCLFGSGEIDEFCGYLVGVKQGGWIECDCAGGVDGLDEIGVGAVGLFGAGLEVEKVAEADDAEGLDSSAGFFGDFAGGGLFRGFAGFGASSDEEMGDAAGGRGGTEVENLLFFIEHDGMDGRRDVGGREDCGQA